MQSPAIPGDPLIDFQIFAKYLAVESRSLRERSPASRKGRARIDYGVLTGTIAEADFAADLAKVICGSASDDYQNADRFFANTYPTQGLKNLLRNVLARLTGDAAIAAGPSPLGESEPAGGMAGFAPAPGRVNRRYRATVSRSIFSSRANRALSC